MLPRLFFLSAIILLILNVSFAGDGIDGERYESNDDCPSQCIGNKVVNRMCQPVFENESFIADRWECQREEYLENHNSCLWVSRSKKFGSMLAGLEDSHSLSRLLGLTKADYIFPKITHVNPYLLGAFVRMASTMPLGKPFEVDVSMAPVAYALTEEMCGEPLIEFIETKPVVQGENFVMRNPRLHSAEKTWRALVVRVETEMLFLERKLDRRIEAVRGKLEEGYRTLRGDAEVPLLRDVREAHLPGQPGEPATCEELYEPRPLPYDGGKRDVSWLEDLRAELNDLTSLRKTVRRNPSTEDS